MVTDRADQLARVSLFADLTPKDLVELAGLVRVKSYPKGRILFGEGDSGDQLYVVAAGRVSVSVSSSEGRLLVLHTFGPGGFFGELAQLRQKPRSAEATALDPCELLLLSGLDFRRFRLAHPSVTERLLSVLGDRLDQTNQLAADIAFGYVRARLARALLELANSQFWVPDDDQTITIRVTQEDLAKSIGATRETVNRGLSIFEEQGLIHRQRGQVTVLQLAGLREHIA